MNERGVREWMAMEDESGNCEKDLRLIKISTDEGRNYGRNERGI